MRAIAFGLLALVGSVRWAAAADLPVRYTVDDKTLRRDAIAGTMLTFQLFNDSACAMPAVHTESVAVESVNVISRLKLLKPQGASPPTKTAELSQTLTGVSASGNLYLKVTGTGVTPLGGTCQAQASAVQSLGAVVVKDANGTVVGTPGVSTQASASGFYILVGSRLGFLPGNLVSGLTNTGGNLLFTTTDCSGQSYLAPDPTPITFRSFLHDGTAYVPALTGTTVAIESVLGLGNSTSLACSGAGGTFIPPASCCIQNSSSGVGAPPMTTNLSGLVTPFHVE